MLRKYTYIFALFSLLGFTAGCSDDLETGQAASNGKGLSLQITIDNNEENASSRTELENADPVNHVTSVQIYIFEGTGDEATYLASEPVDWDGNAQKANRTQHTLQYASLRNGKEYTLLGVGMDGESEATYDVTLSTGTKLQDAYAKLKSGKGQADIAQSEFFTGTVSFEFRGENTNLESLTLRRRVAGVMLYVKDIPQTIDAKRVTKIKLELGQNQKSSVMLQRDFTDLEWKEPGGQESMGDDSKILTEIDLTNTEEFKYDATKDCYQNVDGTGTAYRGVYMLPLNASNANTFTVKLYGKTENDDGSLTGNETQLREFPVRNNSEEGATNFDIRSNYIYCIGKKGEGMDEPISLGDDVILLEVQNWIPIKHEADLGATRVQALFDDTENEIHNCINHEFTLKVLPPSILLNGKVESIKVYTEYMDEPTYGLNTTGNFVSILGDETMEGEEEDVAKAQQLYGKDWLYVKQGDTYDKELELKDNLTPGGEAYTIHLFMEDYARPRKSWGWKVEGLQEGEYSWQGTADDIDYINKDYRYVNIVLETKFIWNGQVYFRYDRMPIKQYNTITVFYKPWYADENYAYCGFSRKDANKDLYPANAYAWGWDGDNNEVVNISIYHPREGDKYNGSVNVKGIGASFSTNTNWKKWWEENGGCASQVAQHLFRKIAEGKIDNSKGTGDKVKITLQEDQTDLCWYLPAQYELEGFMTLTAANTTGNNVVTGIEDKLWYWTSTLPEADEVGETNIQHKAVAYQYDASLHQYKKGPNENRTQTYYIRQARRFPEEYEYAW